MRILASVVIVFLSFSLDVVFAGTHAVEPVLRKRHFVRLPRSENSVSLRRDVSLAKRFDQARFSFYEAGLGACGAVNTAGDFIVALNSEQFDAGGQCFKTITITYNGKSTQAQITDRCPGCPFGGLDFSRGLFNYFASESAGIIYGSWVFGSGEPKPTTTPPPPPPSTTWKPTISSTPPPPSSSTSSSVVSSSSSSIQSATITSAASSTASSAASSVSSTASAVTSSTGDSTPVGILAQLNQIILDLGVIAVAAASGQN